MRKIEVLFVIGLISVLSASCKEGKVNFDGSIFDEDAGVTEDGSAGSDSGWAAVDGGDAAIPEGGEDGGESLPSIDDVPMGLGEAICAALEDCRGTDRLIEDLNGEDCAKRTGSVFANRDLFYLQDSVEAGRVVFHAEQFDSCLADIRAQKCDVKSSRWPASCEQALEGQVALGDKCALDEECEGDAFCDRGANWSCPGTCRKLSDEGGLCRVSHNCREGLVCAGGSCVALLEKDDDCSESTTLCKSGLECVDGLCVSQDEVWSAGEGEECDPPALMCAVDGDEPLSCALQSSGSPLCQARVGEDEPCHRAQPSQCPRSQYCDAEGSEEGVCSDLPDAYENCRPADKSPRCAAGLICESDDKCYPINFNGYACVSNGACFSGICDTDTDNCAAPPRCEL